MSFNFFCENFYKIFCCCKKQFSTKIIGKHFKKGAATACIAAPWARPCPTYQPPQYTRIPNIPASPTYQPPQHTSLPNIPASPTYQPSQHTKAGRRLIIKHYHTSPTKLLGFEPGYLPAHLKCSGKFQGKIYYPENQWNSDSPNQNWMVLY